MPDAETELEALRAALVQPYQAAKARGDTAEMQRLTETALSIDRMLDEIVVGRFRDFSERLTALKARVEAATKQARRFPFDSAPGSASFAAQIDLARSLSDQDRPSRRELGPSIDDLLPASDAPRFFSLSEIQHKYHGARPKGLEGAIVHFDAGRTRPSKGADDAEWGARNMLGWGQTQGFAYATISRSGTIYLPGNMDWNQWGSHAGESECPKTRRSGVSQYYVGFEINNPGLVYPTADANLFVPWFDAVRDSSGRVRINAKGQATIANPDGELYKRSVLRIVASPNGNIQAGAYVPYTRQQYEALVSALLWLKRQHRDTFRLDFVFGHDEVAPKRKCDPGGSLGKPKDNSPGPAQTMSELRSELLKTWAEQQALVA